MKKLIKNPRKGITIAELVIALGIILIIMIASISLLKTSVSVAIRSSAIIEANNSVESIVECFNFSKNKSEFKKYLNDLHGELAESNENGNTVYIIDCGSYSIKIIYTLHENTNGVDGAKYARIEIIAFHNDINETPIYKEKIVYYKGL